MKYEFIKVNRSDHRVVKMCKVLEVNESGYYRWMRRKPSEREKSEAINVAKMKEIHAANYQAYGPTRMQRALAKEKINCSISTVTRLMRCNGLYTVHRIKKQPCPIEVTERLYSENLVDRQFNVPEPNCCWAGDLTYIRSEQGWAYMAVVLDLFNREVVGYAIDYKANSELAKRALEQALLRRRRPKNIIFHSDRGTQYSSRSFQAYLADQQLISSMSKKGTPYDNACCESFFATMKIEWSYWQKFTDVQAIERGAFAYIELFYNHKRMHSSLGYLSPCEYMEKFTNQKA